MPMANYLVVANQTLGGGASPVNTTRIVDQVFAEVGAVACDPSSARVYEHGWQSWSPTTTYLLRDPPYRPSGETTRVLCYRPDCSVPQGYFQGEGLLAVQ